MHTLTSFHATFGILFSPISDSFFGDDTHNNSEILAGLSFFPFFLGINTFHSNYILLLLSRPKDTLAPPELSRHIKQRSRKGNFFRTHRQTFIQATPFCYYYFLEKPNAI
jgi:hypothetical protein